MECVYKGEGISKRKHNCCLKGVCVNKDYSSCDQKLFLTDKEFSKKWQDPLIILDRNRDGTTSLRNLLAGGPAFLVGGGPSAKNIPLEKLNSRGVFSLGVNNSAAHPRFRASAFVCSDPPLKFSHSIWFDPCVMKFVPTPKMSGGRERLREKWNGVFEKSSRKVTNCPNVWGFKRNSWLFTDSRFFLDQGASWGNHNVGVTKTGNEKTVCTMLLGLRILYYLGARQIFLVGVDFRMKPGDVYSFNQGKSSGGCNSNNNQFRVVNDWLCTMVKNKTFENFGVEIYNTYERSGLRAFPYIPFEEAISIATQNVEQIPDLEHWYEKVSCPKCESWHIQCGTKNVCMDCQHVWPKKDND